MSILFGLAAAFGWAGADFLARNVARRIGPYRAFILMQWVGLAALSLYLVVVKDPHWNGFARALTAPSRQAWEWAVLAGLLNIAASISLYHAFSIGKLALVTPIAASYPALTVILAIASGERLKAAAAFGIVLALVGVMLAIIPEKRFSDVLAPPGARVERGVEWALAAALGFGVLFWLLGFRVTNVLGGALSVWLMRLMGASMLLLLVARRRSEPVLPRGSVWWPLAGAALLDTTAFVSNNAGLSTGHVSVVTVLASLFGAVTVLLAWVLLGEQLRRRQWLGIGLIFAGVALVSL